MNHPMPFDPAIRYRGIVERMVDGDTVSVRVDCGFEAQREVHLRVRDLFAYETRGINKLLGEEAKAVALTLAPIGSPVTVTYTQRMSFARYVADVWAVAPDGAQTPFAARLIAMRPDLFFPTAP